MQISEFPIMYGQTIKQSFIIKSISKGTIKSGKNVGNEFLSLMLSDKSGVVKGVMFDNFPADVLESFLVGDVVEVQAVIQEYQGNPSLHIQTVEKEEISSSTNIADFLPSISDEKKAILIAKYKELKEKVTGSQYHSVLEEVESYIWDMYSQAPASSQNHHPYLGGLLEHSVTVAEACFELGKIYKLDISLLITGALLHDIGKVREYTWSKGVIERTVEGKLLGHIDLGGKMLMSIIISSDKIQLTEEKKMKLYHMIVSHHQKREMGSPEVPMTKEAFVLGYCDMIDFFNNHHDELLNGKPGEATYDTLMSQWMVK